MRISRAARGTLAGAMELRSQHLRGLKDVLTVNRNLELKLCEADAQVAAVQAQNDALEAELMRAETAKAPPVPPEGARAESTSQLLAHLRYADASAIKIQRICRGYLCRPLAYGDKANPIILTADGWEEMSEVEAAEIEEAASVYDDFLSGWDEEEEEEEVGDEF